MNTQKTKLNPHVFVWKKIFVPGLKEAVPSVFTTDASVRLLEATLEHATCKYVTQIYAMCFMGHAIDLACDQATNFSVQRLLASIGDKNEVNLSIYFYAMNHCLVL